MKAPTLLLLSLAAALALLCFPCGLGPSQAAGSGSAAPAAVEPALLSALDEDGQADFVVGMAERADLSPAYQIEDWEARGRYVYEALRAVAEHSQAAARRYLGARGVRFQTFLAGNELYVFSGDLDALYALASLPGVSSIRAPRSGSVDPIVDTSPVVDATTSWGILNVKADQFWAQFARRGEGIVVANIDTGVQWNHPALVRQYNCPGEPGNPACWRDPSDVCGGSMCDNNGHGTHTMGTMVAKDDPGLPYIAGMAPGARWIACKGCESNNCSEYALAACADWILAPNGDPANRPHVVNNSWGGDPGEEWYRAEVQAWRAAGIFPAFSAGNSGADCATLGSPGDYPESFGSAAHSKSGTIASFSSRGPSFFGDDPYTKPNLSAPGASICSTVPTNGWSCAYSGTSMASPHSAGAVALLWSCNGALVGQVDRTFQALQQTAGTAPEGTCGAPPDGEGNYTYGYGYLDVYAAGQDYCASQLDFKVYTPFVRR